MLNISNEKEILIQLHEGSASAFEYLYNKYYTTVFLLVSRYIRSEEDAKDIRSRCFMKLWELRGKLKFETMAALYSWIRTTITNSCIDYLRSASIHKEKEGDVSANYLQVNSVEIYEASDKEAIVIERLWKQIEQLPPKCKEVFKMRCLNELKFREIAAILHADLSTVKKRYARAIVILKKLNLKLVIMHFLYLP